MEIAIVKFSDLSKQRTLRMDASYWVKVMTKEKTFNTHKKNIKKRNIKSIDEKK